MRAVFELTINTPLSVGWYDPNTLDPRFYIRPTSVKGLWRWWARAVAAGVLYEAGCVRDLAKETSRAVAEDLGLGSTKAASAYRIRVEVLRPPRVEVVRRRRKSGIQRLDLIALSHDVEYAVGGMFRLTVEGNHRAFAPAVAALALALTLSGLGKGGRKSLGVVDVLDTRGDAPRGGVRELLEAAREGVRVGKCGAAQQGLPSIPAAARGFFEVYKVAAGFPDVHNIFLRPNRARWAAGSFAAPDPMDRNAWFFGLPRRSQRGTGYMDPRGEGLRRPSAVFAAAHSPRHKYGGGTYISLFLSADWPPKLKWVGESGVESIVVDERRVREARDLFLQLIQRWSPQRVWP
jgi:CRISPR-associated protein Cmr1